MTLEAAAQVVVFHQRDRPDIADFLQHIVPYENAGIAVIQSALPEPGIKARQPAGKSVLPVENQPEVSAARTIHIDGGADQAKRSR